MPVDLYCQGADREGEIIKAIEVKNNRAVSSETILTKMKTKAGDKFSQEVLNDDLKRLYATEYFSNVSIDVTDYEDGVKVTFIVEEKSVIEDIVFKGNKAFRSTKLKAMMKSKPNEMLNLSLLAQDIAEIKSFYVKKGYPLVDVKYEIDVDKELNKSTITITVDEKNRVKVAKVTVVGNKAIRTNKIIKVLGTKPAWLFNPGIFKEDVFQEDLDRIKAMYDDMGYLDAEVAPKMDYSEDGKLLYITFEVHEGKQYLVGDITVKGNLVLPEKDVRKEMRLKSGKPFSNRTLRGDAIAIRQLYYNYGYMNVAVDVGRALNPQTDRIDILYSIEAGDPVYVGKVEIKGNLKTKDVVVRRELRIYPGQKFDGSKITRSKERLYNLGLFEDISFDTEPTSNPNVQNLVVNVKEAKTGQFSFGGGYSSIDFLVGFVEVEQKNFDILNFPSFQGAGQDLVIRAELGMVRQNYNISWTEPWIFGYPLSFGFDLYRTTHKKREDIGWPYDEKRTGGDVRFGKEITDNLRADLMYRLEEVEIDSVVDNASQDLKNEVGTNTISSILLQGTYDTRDNIYNPSRGVILNASIENAGGFIGGNKNFLKGTGTASYYHTFFEKFVLELKGRMGIAGPYGKSDEVPIYERFFAGGANTIRGYKERGVGPRDPGSNDPIGGESILLGNAEVTFPIYEKMLKGAVFYDIGNVWRKREDFMVGAGYKYGVGVGIRVKTPLGPFKLDYGYPLVRNHDDKKEGQFYFSISRGF
ncbi:MAG: outer membrane protein assembly factor BamA [Candidatus Omnitrophica bacterium]|nr:outer membrane protein assembly factor BamA [Candidatus Omnitrophota bacterium]